MESSEPDIKRSVGADRTADYFARVGYRKLALDLLIDAAKIIAYHPGSDAAAAELDWVRGWEPDSPISVKTCLASLAAADVDESMAAKSFEALLLKDAHAVLRGLESAKRKFDQMFDGGSSEPNDFSTDFVEQYRIASMRQ